MLPRPSARGPALVALVAALLRPAVAQAEPPDDYRARIAFLEQRIAAQELHAELWWKGWTSFYFFGAIFQGARAASAVEPAAKADLWVSFAKASVGTMRFALMPYQGITGLEPAPRQSGFDPAEHLQRAEHVLEHNAARTNAFGRWWAHPINFGVNGLGAVIVGAGYDDWSRGLISAAIGVAVGEVSLLTAPWEADDDLAEYRARWGVLISGTEATLQLRW
jgi:hypothetical protein